jgi:uncharacterized protein YkwD
MNIVDLLIVICLVFFVVEGMGRTFLGEALDLLSFLVAFFLSLRFYNYIGGFLESSFQIPHSVANVLGFLIFWFVAESIFFILIHFILSKSILLIKVFNKINRLAFIPAFFRGIIFISIVLTLLASFPIQPKIKILVNESKIGSLILDKTQQLESPIKNVFGGLSNDTMTFMTVKPKSDESVNLGFQTDKFSPNESLESQMIVLVNKERTERGLTALAFDPILRDVGRGHSADMFKRGYFAHTSPEGQNVADRVEKAGITYEVVGENLAYAPSLSLAHTGLMNSPGHKANILSPDYHKVGIGIEDGGVYGLMVTQVFSN